MRRLDMADSFVRFENIEGMMHRTELALLYQFAKNLPPDAVAVEIGSYRGKSTLTIAQGLQDGNGGLLHAIDPHPQYFDYGEADGEVMRRNVRESGLTNINIIEDYADNVVDSFKEPIHLLWIDGDHTYDGVCSDFKNYTPLLAEGGIVALHDTHLSGPWRVFVDNVLKGSGFDSIGICRLILYARRGGSAIPAGARVKIFLCRQIYAFLAGIKARLNAMRKKS